MTDSDSHGTSVTGQIAMVRDNGICGVGVAYDTKYAGIRYTHHYKNLTH